MSIPRATFPTDQHVSVVPLAVRPAQAALMLGISERKLWELTNRGLIPHARIGRAVVYRVADLEAWLLELTRNGGQR